MTRLMVALVLGLVTLAGCDTGDYRLRNIDRTSEDCPTPPRTVEITVENGWGISRQFCVAPDELTHASLNEKWTGRIPG